uniref:Propeptide_C25 domain-containing protein n=1 Tax=Ascaris lumbricoides TaxID=6252 RepID=A0A0M3HP62_ASCLU
MFRNAQLTLYSIIFQYSSVIFKHHWNFLWVRVLALCISTASFKPYTTTKVQVTVNEDIPVQVSAKEDIPAEIPTSYIVVTNYGLRWERALDYADNAVPFDINIANSCRVRVNAIAIAESIALRQVS